MTVFEIVSLPEVLGGGEQGFARNVSGLLILEKARLTKKLVLIPTG
jgi:hypothetical protein